MSEPIDETIQARLARAARLVEGLRSIAPAQPTGKVFDAYVQAVGELRAVARDAHQRVDQMAAVLADAREFTARRRRRAAKAAEKRARSGGATC